MVCFSKTTFAGGLSFSMDSGSSPPAVSISAEKAPLQDILRRFSRHGVTVRADPDINPEISVSFQNRDLQKALSTLLAELNHVLLWERLGADDYRLREIQVFRAGQKNRMRALPARPVLPVAVDPDTGRAYVKNEILLAFSPETPPEAAARYISAAGGRIIGRHRATGVYRIRFAPGKDIPALAKSLDGRKGVVAEPNYAYRIAPAPVLETTAPAVSAPAPLREGAAPVAVMDTGIAADHAENARVIAAFDALSPESTPADALGHGTQMAYVASGTIQPHGPGYASGGASPVIAVRAFDDNGYTTSAHLTAGIDYAKTAGARILSLSWGTEIPGTFLRRAMEYADQSGLTVVASAGNEPTGSPIYPAAFETVIGVGALAPDGTPWRNTNHGDFVSLYAPGFAHLPVGYEGEPGLYAGTSIAAAYIANQISGKLAENPRLTPRDIREAVSPVAELE